MRIPISSVKLDGHIQSHSYIEGSDAGDLHVKWWPSMIISHKIISITTIFNQFDNILITVQCNRVGTQELSPPTGLL